LDDLRIFREGRCFVGDARGEQRPRMRLQVRGSTEAGSREVDGLRRYSR